MPGPYISTGTSVNLSTDLGTPTLANGDSVYVGRGKQDYTDATANDLTVGGTIDLLLCDLLPGWGGTFPTATPLKLVANRTATGRLRIRGSGQAMCFIRSTSMAAGVVYGIEQQTMNINLKEVDNEFYALRGGTLFAESTADINKLYASGFGIGNLLASGPTMAEAGVGDQATLNLHRSATLVACYGNGTLNINEKAIAPTNAYLYGGRFNHRGGAITNFYAYSGVLDLTEMPQPVTITNFYGLGEIVIRIRQAQSSLLTITNTIAPYVNPPRYEYV